jgi:hypothetical protein
MSTRPAHHLIGNIDEIRDEFALTCEQKANEISKRGFHFVCCVDGSESSNTAFNIAISLRKKHDILSIFHTFKDDQSGIPERFNSNSIKSRYEHEVEVQCLPGESAVCWEPRHSRSVVETTLDFVEACREANNAPHFVVFGHAGRKEGGKSHERGYFSPLSSNCSSLLRMLQLPCIIAKKAIPLRREKKHWVMAVDGTQYSDRGLDILLHLVGPKDQLTLFYVFSTESDEVLKKMENSYSDELENFGPSHSHFEIIPHTLGMDLGHSIVNFVNNSRADIFAIAPRARSAGTLSPLTEYLIENVESSLIVCKN